MLSSMYPFYYIDKKVYRIYAVNCCEAKVVECHISNVISEKILVLNFVYLYFIWIKIFYTDQVMGKIVRTILFYEFILIYYSFLDFIINASFF